MVGVPVSTARWRRSSFQPSTSSLCTVGLTFGVLTKHASLDSFDSLVPDVVVRLSINTRRTSSSEELTLTRSSCFARILSNIIVRLLFSSIFKQISLRYSALTTDNFFSNAKSWEERQKIRSYGSEKVLFERVYHKVFSRKPDIPLCLSYYHFTSL